MLKLSKKGEGGDIKILKNTENKRNMKKLFNEQLTIYENIKLKIKNIESLMKKCFLLMYNLKISSTLKGKTFFLLFFFKEG